MSLKDIMGNMVLEAVQQMLNDQLLYWRHTPHEFIPGVIEHECRVCQLSQWNITMHEAPQVRLV